MTKRYILFYLIYNTSRKCFIKIYIVKSLNSAKYSNINLNVNYVRLF